MEIKTKYSLGDIVYTPNRKFIDYHLTEWKSERSTIFAILYSCTEKEQKLIYNAKYTESDIFDAESAAQAECDRRNKEGK